MFNNESQRINRVIRNFTQKAEGRCLKRADCQGLCRLKDWRISEKRQIKKDRLIDKKKNIGYNSRQIKHTKILGIKRR